VASAAAGATTFVTTGAAADAVTGSATGVMGMATGVEGVAVKGAGAASPAELERKRLLGDPAPAAGRRDDEAPAVAWSIADERPREAAVARAMSAARKGSSLSLVGFVAAAVAAGHVRRRRGGRAS
jgi:hypothetical protein